MDPEGGWDGGEGLSVGMLGCELGRLFVFELWIDWEEE